MRVLASSVIYTSWTQSIRNLLAIVRRKNKHFHLVSSYEEEFARVEGFPFVRSTSMARVALWHGLRALGVKAGDHIVLSPVNIPEMLAVIESYGLIPVYVDFTPQSLFIDPQDLEQKLSKSKAKICFLTLIAGQMGELDLVFEICHKHQVILIQDATQANLSFYKGKSLGHWADITIFSTCELKFVHTYRGGMIGTHSEKIFNDLVSSINSISHSPSSLKLLQKWFINTAAALVLHPRLFGSIFHKFSTKIFVQDPNKNFRKKDKSFGVDSVFGNDYLEIKNKLPEAMIYRLSDFEAQTGLEDLRLMPFRVKRHQEIAAKYKLMLENTTVLPVQSVEAKGSYWRFPILLPDSKKVNHFRSLMDNAGVIIEKTGLSYLPESPHLKAHSIINNMVFLPCHASLTDEELERVGISAKQALETL